ncbi:hypothetical protein PMAYCL1PPCAC_13701, partial [Pristionchus mayeri]
APVIGILEARVALLALVDILAAHDGESLVALVALAHSIDALRVGRAVPGALHFSSIRDGPSILRGEIPDDLDHSSRDRGASTESESLRQLAEHALGDGD